MIAVAASTMALSISWVLIIFLLSLTLTLTLKLLLTSSSSLPPGPSAIIFLAKNILFRRKSLFELELILRDLHSTYGPIISLHSLLLPNPTIFIQDRHIAHQALIHNGAAFADRPSIKEPMLCLTCNRHDINTSRYGPLWRVLRRNLTSEMLHPSRVRLFAPARRWAVQVLRDGLGCSDKESVLVVRDKLRFMMFCLLSAMCFGEKLEEAKIEEIREIQYSLLGVFTRFNFFAVLPRITKALFRRKWDEIVGFRERQAEIFVPLIRARKERRKRTTSSGDEHFLGFCYVDSLIDLEIPAEEGGRKLTEDEIVNLCHEFLSGATDTTLTGLEWILAELVEHQDVQERLVQEIGKVVPKGEEIMEEDLQKMPYLKAVIMEGLRRHPPGHFVLPHRATQDAELGGYLVPKGAEVHINVAQLGWEEKLWEGAMEFRPERFMENGEFNGEVVDLTGSREIKMMPFGAGRRMCPGYGLAVLHLEYFVANLVRELEWKSSFEGETIDLSETFEFTTVMKNPLRVRLYPR